MESIFVSHLRRIYSAGIEAVKPSQLIRQALRLDASTDILHVKDGHQYKLDRNVLVIGFGKAVLEMTVAVHSLIKHHIKHGVISVPIGAIKQLQDSTCDNHNIGALLSDERIRIIEGSPGNLPDVVAQKTAQDILKLVKDATQDELILALVSGGGSSLLPLPVEEISLEHKRRTIELLSAAGVTINQLNIVRQSLSQVKGGKLAGHVYPARLLGLILSDIIGDPLEHIASGPTIPQSSNHHITRQILERYHHLSLPHSVTQYISRLDCSSDGSTTTVMPPSHVCNVLVGSNAMAVKGAADKARECGYNVIVWTHALQGEARELGQFYAKLAQMLAYGIKKERFDFLTELRKFLSSVSISIPEKDLLKLSHDLSTSSINSNSSGKVCLISGGEPTVTLRGNGCGGRNQELTLSFAKHIHDYLLVNGGDEAIKKGERNVTVKLVEASSQLEERDERKEGDSEATVQLIFGSIGTDGQDGPTDAAGAMADSSTWSSALEQGLDPNYSLDTNDSYRLFSDLSNGQYHIKTGLTGTNVMDIHILLIDYNIKC